MKKVRKMCTKVVIDYVEGESIWTWRLAKPEDPSYVKVDKNTLSRWDSVQELYDLYQEELGKLDNGGLIGP